MLREKNVRTDRVINAGRVKIVTKAASAQRKHHQSIGESAPKKIRHHGIGRKGGRKSEKVFLEREEKKKYEK